MLHCLGYTSNVLEREGEEVEEGGGGGGGSWPRRTHAVYGGHCLDSVCLSCPAYRAHTSGLVLLGRPTFLPVMCLFLLVRFYILCAIEASALILLGLAYDQTLSTREFLC